MCALVLSTQGRMQPKVIGEDNLGLTLNQLDSNLDRIPCICRTCCNQNQCCRRAAPNGLTLQCQSLASPDQANRPEPGCKRGKLGNHMRSMHIKIQGVGIGLAQIDRKCRSDWISQAWRVVLEGVGENPFCSRPGLLTIGADLNKS